MSHLQPLSIYVAVLVIPVKFAPESDNTIKKFNNSSYCNLETDIVINYIKCHVFSYRETHLCLIYCRFYHRNIENSLNVYIN